MAKRKKTLMSSALIAAQAARKKESKRRADLSNDQRFGESASSITSAVIRNLRKLGRLAIRPGFEYTKDQRVKMFQAIHAEVDQSETKYIVRVEGKKKGASEFNF